MRALDQLLWVLDAEDNGAFDRAMQPVVRRAIEADFGTRAKAALSNIGEE